MFLKFPDLGFANCKSVNSQHSSQTEIKGTVQTEGGGVNTGLKRTVFSFSKISCDFIWIWRDLFNLQKTVLSVFF